MAIKTISIGTAKDIFRFDDGDTEYGIETTGKIKADTAPTANDEVVRFQDLPGFADIVSATANIGNNKAVRGDGGAKGIQDSDVDIKDGGDISIPTGKGYQVNDIQVVTDQQAAEADLAAVPDLTGADTIDQADLETYLGDIRTKLNNLLAKLRTHGLIDT
jgi:hypothetical protein